MKETKGEKIKPQGQRIPRLTSARYSGFQCPLEPQGSGRNDIDGEGRWRRGAKGSRRCAPNKASSTVASLPVYLPISTRPGAGKEPRGRASWRPRKRPGLAGLLRELREPRARPPGRSEGGRGAGRAGAGPGAALGEGERGGPSPGAVNFSWAAACQPQKALKVQQPAPASTAAFVRVIYDFNLGSPRVHTAFAAVEG